MAAETTRVKDIPTTATTAAADDYVLLDGATNGTRKGLASNLITPAAAITAADITDLASGRGPLLTGTPAQARAAIGVYEPALNSAGVVLIGSSTFAEENTSTFEKSAHGPINNGMALAGANLRVMANLAQGGSLMAAHLTQFESAMAMKPSAILWQLGANDLFQSVTTATLWPQVLACIARCQDERIFLILRATQWRGLSAPQLKEAMKLRMLIQAAALDTPYVKCADAWSVYIDRTSTGTGAAKTNYLEDGTHPSNLGAYREGKEIWAPLFSQMFPPVPFPFSEGCDANGSGVNYLGNPALLGTNGTLGTGAAGTVPTGWTLARFSGSAGTATGSNATNSDGDPVYRIAITGSANGEIFSLVSPYGQNVMPQGTYEVSARIKMVDAITLSHPYLTMGGCAFFKRSETASLRFALGESGAVFYLRGKRIVDTSNFYANGTLYLYVVGGSTGTVEIDGLGVRWIGT